MLFLNRRSYSGVNEALNLRHPKFVQELLGHASVAITLDNYSQMLPGMGGEAANAMGAALG